MDEERIRNLITNGNIPKAIQLMNEVDNQLTDINHSNTLTLLSSRNSRLNTNRSLGIISNDEADRESNRITLALLSVLNELAAEYTRQHPESDNSSDNGSSTPSSDNKDKQKIIFLSANPTDSGRLQTDREYRLIKNRVKGNQHLELLSPELAMTVEDLIIAMNQRPSIVHYAGHGETKGILIATDHNKTQLMPTRALRRLFNQHKEYVKIIILNSCYSEEQAKVISELGMHVVGMNAPVGDMAAIDFAQGLYIGLTEGKDLDKAFDDAMVILDTKHSRFAHLPKVWKDGNCLDWN